MKAVVFHGVGDIRLDDVPDPKLQEPTDAIVRLTAIAICGTDLHMIRGTLPGMKKGTVLGHEGVGVVEKVGKDVRNLKPGDRVVIPSTICCGSCEMCRHGFYSQCDRANPNGPQAGTAFYGGPESTGPFDGLQAERARIPFAHVNLVKLPNDVTDDQAILLSDILPTAYFGCDLAGIQPGAVVAIFGCGPVGQLAIACARHLGAGRIFAIDCVPSRLEAARYQGAEVIHYEEEDPVEVIRELTAGKGVTHAIDAVGVDSNHPHHGPAEKRSKAHEAEFKEEVEQIVREENPQGDNWHPGDAPSQALLWSIECLQKAGTLSIIGVYPLDAKLLPIGNAMEKNLTIKMGNCNHRKYIPMLIDWVRMGVLDPSKLISQEESLLSAIEAYQKFDTRQPGWLKVELAPPQGAKAA
jgi:threonine dehydrogenase-like Zn-dependent dehydrogenase